MVRKRQKIQLELAFDSESRGEAPMAENEGTELTAVGRSSQSPANARLLEVILSSGNMRKALQRVKSNKGSPGVDGLTVEELPAYLRDHWEEIRRDVLEGTYTPSPVRRVEIPKPNGGVRKLGIPTVVDRLLQQAILQCLQPQWDRTFSNSSYGFRPGRSAHKAVAKAQSYLAEGYRFVVDFDLEKFFDRVNHDVLMSRVARRVKDKRVLKLIRGYLTAGIFENGLVSPSDEGTPQGGPLSPLLSNLLLDELDKELERRNLRFVRYADDFNVYVRSERAGHRVLASTTKFLEKKLRLRVNQEKSGVGRPWQRQFLGFSFTNHRDQPRRRIGPKARRRFKERVRELTSRNRGQSLRHMVENLTVYLRGWRGYFGRCQTPSVLRGLDSWILRRLRQVQWKFWRRGRVRYRELRRLGLPRDRAAITASSNLGPWRKSRSPGMQEAFPVAYFRALGLPSLASR